MAILKLKSAYKDYIWGGRRLIEEYNKDYSGDMLAESWELSCIPGVCSIVENGKDAGLPLPEYIQKYGSEEILGSNCKRFTDFPVLVKLIDAREKLSVQVHPDDDYAVKHEAQSGKTEMWYVLEAEEGACIYCGLKKRVSKSDMLKVIENNTMEDVLESFPARRGDVFFIKSGTIHAIGKGIVVAEIQQNSDVTYRMYDYGRKNKDGAPRKLCIEDALSVARLEPAERTEDASPHIAKCKYFTVDKIEAKGEPAGRHLYETRKDSFEHILFVDGSGSIRCDGEVLPYRKGDGFLLTAGSGELEIDGKFEALITSEDEA